MIFKLTITKGYNFIKVLVKLWFLIVHSSLNIVCMYIYMPGFGRICQGFQSKRGAAVAQWVKRWPTDLADRVRSSLEAKSSLP